MTVTTIPTGGSDIHLIPRPNGGWTVQQGKSRVYVTNGEARLLVQAFKNLLAPRAPGGEEIGPITCKPPIIRYRSPVTSEEILDYVNSRPDTVAADLVDQFDLSHEAAAKHLQRLYEQRLVRKPQHGIYAPLTAPQADVLDGMG